MPVTLVDGGYCANNPTLYAIADALGEVTDLLVRNADGRLAVVAGVAEDRRPDLAQLLALAAGALIYVINELFALGRRLCKPPALAWGLLLGFLAAYSTDLYLTYLAV